MVPNRVPSTLAPVISRRAFPVKLHQACRPVFHQVFHLDFRHCSHPRALQEDQVTVHIGQSLNARAMVENGEKDGVNNDFEKDGEDDDYEVLL